MHTRSQQKLNMQLGFVKMDTGRKSSSSRQRIVKSRQPGTNWEKPVGMLQKRIDRHRLQAVFFFLGKTYNFQKKNYTLSG